MKKILFITLLILLGFTKGATAVQLNCKEISLLAESIMEARQHHGYSLQHMLDRAQGNHGVIEMIKLAYKEPVYSDEIAKNRAVKTFTDNIYGGCFNRHQKGKEIIYSIIDLLLK